MTERETSKGSMSDPSYTLADPRIQDLSEPYKLERKGRCKGGAIKGLVRKLKELLFGEEEEREEKWQPSEGIGSPYFKIEI